MITNNNLKRVWYDGLLWAVENVLSPNPHQDFLFLRRIDERHAFDDGTEPVQMVVVDCHNDIFYPDSTEVRQRMMSIRRAQSTISRHEKKLQELWLRAARNP